MSHEAVLRDIAGRIPGVKKFMLGGTAPGYDSFEEAVAAMPATPIADSPH